MAINATCRGGGQGGVYWPAPEARPEITQFTQVAATKCTATKCMSCSATQGPSLAKRLAKVERTSTGDRLRAPTPPHRFLGPCCSSAAAAGPAGRQKGPPLIARWLEFRRPVHPSLPVFAIPAPSLPWPFLAGAIHGTRGIKTVPSMAPSWVFLCRHALPVHLSRNLYAGSAGGEAFTCRLRPFAGGSSWQRLIALPIAHADPKRRERSAATATRGWFAMSLVAAMVRAELPGRRPRPARRPLSLLKSRPQSVWLLPVTPPCHGTTIAGRNSTVNEHSRIAISVQQTRTPGGLDQRHPRHSATPTNTDSRAAKVATFSARSSTNS